MHKFFVFRIEFIPDVFLPPGHFGGIQSDHDFAQPGNS